MTLNERYTSRQNLGGDRGGVMKENYQIPKTLPCKECGKKPKHEIIAWSYGDSDDEFFFVHWCKGKHIRFPERGTFTAWRIEGQMRKVLDSWNENQANVLYERT